MKTATPVLWAGWADDAAVLIRGGHLTEIA